MIDYIKGYLMDVQEDSVVIENHAIGYKIQTSVKSIVDFQAHEGEVLAYTQMIVRDDYIGLCGFSSRDELNMFNLLTSVSGVGTKVGLGILSSIDYISLYEVIVNGDEKSLVKAQGVGKKTAQRIILELKDKIEKLGLISVNTIGEEAKKSIVDNRQVEDAVLALESLGYSKVQIRHVIKGIDMSQSTTEDIIKVALSQLAGL